MKSPEERIKNAREYIKSKIERSFRVDWGLPGGDRSDRLFTETVVEMQIIDSILMGNDVEVKEMGKPVCCFCGKECENEWGNNPWPVNKDEEARCCNECNMSVVVPARLAQAVKKDEEKEGE